MGKIFPKCSSPSPRLYSVVRGLSQNKSFPQVNLPRFLIRRQKMRGAGHFDFSVAHNVGAVRDRKGLAHAVIRKQNAQPLSFQSLKNLLNLEDGDGIDAAE